MRLETFQVGGYTHTVDVPCLYLEPSQASDRGVPLYSPLYRFIFFQGDPPLVAQIGAAGLGVYAAMLAHRQHQSGLACPSQRRLARMLNIQPPAIRRHLDILCDVGLLVRLPRQANGRPTGRRDWYYVNAPIPGPPPSGDTARRISGGESDTPPESVCESDTPTTQHTGPKPAPLPASGPGGRAECVRIRRTVCPNQIHSVSESAHLSVTNSNTKELNKQGTPEKQILEPASLSAIAGRIRRLLFDAGIQGPMVQRLIESATADDILAAAANAEALDRAGQLTNRAGYIVRTVLAAGDERARIRPTRLRRQQTAATTEATTARIDRSALRITERAAAAHKRLGDADRWPEIPLAEVAG